MNDEQTIFVVDDDVDLRRSLKWMLTKAGLNVETFSSAEDFLENHDPHLSGCVLLDLRMPGMDGIQVQEQMIEQGWTTPVIVLSGYADVPTTVTVMQRGAVSVLEKPFSRHDLLDRIHEALEKDTESRRNRSEHIKIKARFMTLTAREREVMGMVINGMSTKQIAYHLDRSPRTIDIHRRHIMEKMCVDSVAELATLSVQHGIDVPKVDYDGE